MRKPTHYLICGNMLRLKIQIPSNWNCFDKVISLVQRRFVFRLKGHYKYSSILLANMFLIKCPKVSCFISMSAIYIRCTLTEKSNSSFSSSGRIFNYSFTPHVEKKKDMLRQTQFQIFILRSESKTVYCVVIALFQLDKQFSIEEINQVATFYTRI